MRSVSLQAVASQLSTDSQFRFWLLSLDLYHATVIGDTSMDLWAMTSRTKCWPLQMDHQPWHYLESTVWFVLCLA